MSKRKESFVHFVHGKTPRIYVNPSNKDELVMLGPLVRKPHSKKLAKVPMELWKLENGQIVAPSIKGQAQSAVKIQEYITTKVEETSMKKSKVIEELVGQLEEIKEDVLKVQAEHEKELAKFSKKGSSIKYLVAVILCQSAALIYTYLPQIEKLLK
jgi:hypothetical protein